MRRLLPLLIIVGLMTGCASKDIARSWVGKKVDDLIYSWGPPSAAHEFGDGRNTLKFSHHRIGGGPLGSQSLYCNVIFASDEHGIIQTVDIDGNIGGCNRLLGGKSAAPK